MKILIFYWILQSLQTKHYHLQVRLQNISDQLFKFLNKLSDWLFLSAQTTITSFFRYCLDLNKRGNYQQIPWRIEAISHIGIDFCDINDYLSKEFVNNSNFDGVSSPTCFNLDKRYVVMLLKNLNKENNPFSWMRN